MQGEHDFTELLSAASGGDAEAGARLYTLAYRELHRIARSHLRGGDPALPRTTSLVHEAYLRLARIEPGRYASRSHFLSTASRAMRQILIEHARRRGCAKRGGGHEDLALLTGDAAAAPADADLFALDAALHSLERADSELAQLVEWRFFGGLTVPEIAEACGRSESSVKRDLREASAFLRLRLDATQP